MEIEILCTKLIKPFLPTPPHLQRYKISEKERPDCINQQQEGMIKMNVRFFVLIKVFNCKLDNFLEKTRKDLSLAYLFWRHILNFFLSGQKCVRSPEWEGNDEVDKLLSSSFCNFPLHDIDFDIHSEVGVQVDLKESYMHLFECDDDIKALMFIRDANL
ncbi:hypothetical protein H5410_059880 [Solanum commersonii]|uniref:Uncharacterized protein n=1 Tax=Solanum commersonii TaxID=4109 RepID=A0A9J5W3Q4_SOLCO|nr:hypothetical protein H5410_059880 [Solanum commersonii]